MNTLPPQPGSPHWFASGQPRFVDVSNLHAPYDDGIWGPLGADEPAPESNSGLIWGAIGFTLGLGACWFFFVNQRR